MLRSLYSSSRPGSAGTSAFSAASKGVDANRARARKARRAPMNKPIGRTQREGSTLANPENVAKKTVRGSPLAFKSAAKNNSLIEWNPSRQAQILDWHHRAKDYGLAVEEREDVQEGHPYEIEPRQLLEEEEP